MAAHFPLPQVRGSQIYSSNASCKSVHFVRLVLSSSRWAEITSKSIEPREDLNPGMVGPIFLMSPTSVLWNQYLANTNRRHHYSTWIIRDAASMIGCGSFNFAASKFLMLHWCFNQALMAVSGISRLLSPSLALMIQVWIRAREPFEFSVSTLAEDCWWLRQIHLTRVLAQSGCHESRAGLLILVNLESNCIISGGSRSGFNRQIFGIICLSVCRKEALATIDTSVSQLSLMILEIDGGKFVHIDWE